MEACRSASGHKVREQQLCNSAVWKNSALQITLSNVAYYKVILFNHEFPIFFN